ncbi:MAG: arginine--tRNA ligase [Pseudobdellovibrionaceae bacterium]|jgi:arginyl-tRNA synthetase|nr:arginine--tRNA ligase [Pseudobdellovibrionaceae bacterium]
MFDQSKVLLSQIIVDTLSSLGITADRERVYQSIEFCPQPELGQYAFKTFIVAKQAGMNPMEFGTKLCDALNTAPLILKVSQAGPYINLILSSESIASLLSQEGLSGDVAAIKPPVPHRYMIEHSQPNTHKEMHIGHTRNSVLGDTLCRLLKHNGYSVFAQNYHGDEGAHVAKCIWYIRTFNQSPAEGQDHGTWLGQMYVDSTAKIESATPEEAEQYKAGISAVLKGIESREGPDYAYWKETRQWSLDMFHEVYNWLDVSFDSDCCESDVSEESISVVKEYLDKGVFIRSEGAVGADLSDKKLGFCMLLKSDGNGLYATKDIALALKRFRDQNPDTCVYVVDNRQSYHFKQVFATLDTMGFQQANRCYHLAYEMVETKNGAMSSRKGNIVPILGLIDELEAQARGILEERYSADWSVEEIAEVAKLISRSAVRYGMIKVDPESKIVFDMESWLTFEGNTGPYLQYVYARICSLQRKSSDDDINLSSDISWSTLDKVSEQQLLAHLANFNEMVDVSCTKLKPNMFASYTYDLARKFNAFYAECPINSEPDASIRHARSALVRLTQIYLGTAMDLLGIPRIERM